MKMQYDLLYRNGREDSIVQEGSEKEIADVNEVIRQGIENDDVEGILTFGDGKGTGGYQVRLSSLDRVRVTVLDAGGIR